MTKILIVEDDAMNCQMFTRYISRAGYEVITASDGAQAVGKARNEQPDLIIMDMGLPILNGWQATQRIRKHPATHTIPIIALTAYAMEEDRQKCLAIGCNEYETKPINFDQLLLKMRTILKEKAPAANEVV